MYNKNRDLILFCLFGFIYYALIMAFSGHLTKAPAIEYFIAPFILSLFLGCLTQASHQIIEWPLCFLFGGMTASTTLVGILSYLGMSFNIAEFAGTISHTFAYFGVMAALILTGLVVIYFLRLTLQIILSSLRLS